MRSRYISHDPRIDSMRFLKQMYKDPLGFHNLSFIKVIE